MPMLRGSHREILAAMKGNDAVGPARLAHHFLPNPGKPGFGGGEGGERSEPGGGSTLAPCSRPPPTPNPSPPRASRMGGGEQKRPAIFILRSHANSPCTNQRGEAVSRPKSPSR